MPNILTNLRRELQQNSTSAARTGGQRFFKEEIKLYGLSTAVVDKIAKAYFKEIKDRPKAEIFELCDELWKSGYMEEVVVACRWSYLLRKKYEAADFKVFEKWVSKYVSNWAMCDALCNHPIGEFLEQYPVYVQEMKKWAKSENRWMRRAAVVSLIIPARKGKFLNDIFEIADILLTDREDLVQKGYGWMLKSAGQAHQQEVFEYVMSKKSVMPRTALRYAIEKMPKELRLQAMQK